jgi:hypothetical protein
MKARRKRREKPAQTDRPAVKVTKSTKELMRENRRRAIEGWLVVLFLVAIAIGVEILITRFGHR